MDAAPVLATWKRSDRLPEDPGGPCRAWIESDVKGGLYNDFQQRDPIRSTYWVSTARVETATHILSIKSADRIPWTYIIVTHTGLTSW